MNWATHDSTIHNLTQFGNVAIKMGVIKKFVNYLDGANI